MPANPDDAAFTFADIFGGIGGFHAALSAAGGHCTDAVEIDDAAARVYTRNWGHDPKGDITMKANDDGVTVADHEVLAAGYPCQPFSKSGKQRGMDEARGTLFWNIARIAQIKQPKVLLLENVRNVAGPRHEHEWTTMVTTLRQLGYRVADLPAVMSPHLIPPEMGGRPQVRERVFLTATYVGTDAPKSDLIAEPIFRNRPIVSSWDPQNWDLEKHLPLDPDRHAEGCDLSVAERHWIRAWDAFVQMMWELRHGKRLEGFPLWVDAWVPWQDFEMPPGTPPWKASFLIKNSKFYTDYQSDLDRWIAEWGVKTDAFPPSRRKFEWQAQDTPTLKECVMHFRPSGIRAKRPTYLPALVAITQTSIIGSRDRRLSTVEAARLQGLPDWFDFGDQRSPATYRQLGNGVNVGVVWHVLKAHVERDKDILRETAPRLFAAVDALPDSPDSLLEAMRR